MASGSYRVSRLWAGLTGWRKRVSFPAQPVRTARSASPCRARVRSRRTVCAGRRPLKNHILPQILAQNKGRCVAFIPKSAVGRFIAAGSVRALRLPGRSKALFSTTRKQMTKIRGSLCMECALPFFYVMSDLLWSVLFWAAMVVVACGLAWLTRSFGLVDHEQVDRPFPRAAQTINHQQSNPIKSSNAVLFCAVGLIAAFFMPWFQLMNFGVSGYQLAQLGSYGNYAWIIPILAALTVVVGASGRNNGALGVITGIAPLLAVAYGYFRWQAEFGDGATKDILEILQHVVGIGVYLTLILSAVIIFLGARKVEE